jgi:hypothetical protein
MPLIFHEENHTYELDGVKLPSVTEILSPFSGNGSINPATLQHAAHRGHLVHSYTELIDYGVPPEDIDIVPELAGYVSAYLRFLRDWQPTWELIEHPVHYGKAYAGTLDRYGMVDGTPILLDIKSTSGASRQQKVVWALQLEGYDRALPPKHPKRAKHIDLHLKSNGKYTLYDAADTEKRYGFDSRTMFDSCLRIHKARFGGTLYE